MFVQRRRLTIRFPFSSVMTTNIKSIAVKIHLQLYQPYSIRSPARHLKRLTRSEILEECRMRLSYPIGNISLLLYHRQLLSELQI